MDAEAALPPTRRHTWLARVRLLGLLALCALGVDLDWPTTAGRGQDPALYAAVVRDMRAGFGYYEILPFHLHARGYAHASPFNYRPPTLAALMAAFPSDAYPRALLATIALATLATWFWALRRHARAMPCMLAVAGLAGLAVWSVVGSAFRVHETWAGMILALSLGLSAVGLAVPAMVATLAALAVRELALPYALAALVFALRSGTRAERRVGLYGTLALGLAYGAHQLMVLSHAGHALDARAPWLAFGGWQFVLSTARMNLWLLLTPVWVAAVGVPLCLAGLTAVPGPLGPRVRALVFTYVVVFLAIGLPYNHLWGLMYAGPLVAGIAFAPAAFARMWKQAFPGKIASPAVPHPPL